MGPTSSAASALELGSEAGVVAASRVVETVGDLRVEGGATATFERVYDENVQYIWRALRRLGVAEANVDDAVQDVFVVVHRRLGDFEGRSSVRTWLYGIALRVAREHRRRAQRTGVALPDDVEAPSDASPHSRSEKAEAARVLDRLLSELDDTKREVFVLAEIEQLSVPEIAETLGTNVNTTYSQLRAARKQLDEAVRREKARDGWRLR
ncbi:MAG: RNA polymerase sigma factor [Deltaproteobacteria bacterium]|nr:RNA polymerase sigma factor [Deltaproteobacteria bacterium]